MISREIIIQKKSSLLFLAPLFRNDLLQYAFLKLNLTLLRDTWPLSGQKKHLSHFAFVPQHEGQASVSIVGVFIGKAIVLHGVKTYLFGGDSVLWVRPPHGFLVLVSNYVEGPEK